MDVRCLCTHPLSAVSSAFHCAVHRLPSEPGVHWQPCRCGHHSAGFHQGLLSHLNQSCKQSPSGITSFATKDQSPYPCLINRSLSGHVQKTEHAVYPDRCVHFHPRWSVAHVDRRGTPPVIVSCAAFSRDPMQEATVLTEHKPIPARCTIYPLDTRGLDPIGQDGYCAPSAPMHYAIYSSPVSLSYSTTEGCHRFSNNVPPVLLAVYHGEQGSLPLMEQLAQIDRSPTPSIFDSCLAFSRD